MANSWVKQSWQTVHDLITFNLKVMLRMTAQYFASIMVPLVKFLANGRSVLVRTTLINRQQN